MDYNKKTKKQLINELIELREKNEALISRISLESHQEAAEAEETNALLRDSRESFRALTENSRDVIMRFDSQHRHLYVNSAVERETGIPARKFIGKTHKELGFPEHLCNLWESAIQKVFDTGEVHRIEFMLPSNIWIDWLLMPEFYQDGSVKHVITTARDITERKHMEQELKNYQKHLEKLVDERTIDLKQEISTRKKTEESLRSSEEKFRALTESTSDWIWEVDEFFVFTYTSPKVKDLLGYESDEVIGKTPFDFMPEEEKGRLSEIAHTIMASRKPFISFENINLHKDGHHVIIETSGIPIFDKNGNFSGYRGIDRDITERKRAAEALEESESRLRKLSDNLPNGLVYEVDTGEDGSQRKFLYISAGVEKMHGITVTEVLDNAMSIYGQIIEEDRQRLAQEEAFALKNMLPFRQEVRMRLPSGEIRWRLFTSAPRRLPNNHLVWDGIEIDITEHKLLDEALDISKEKYRLVVENANDAIFIVQEGIIKFPNFKTMQLSGYTEQELTSVPFSQFIHHDDKDMVMDMHRKRLQGLDIPVNYSFRVVTKSGEILWVEASAVLVTWEGTPASLSFLRDITAQKKLEAQLLQVHKMEAIGQLAGGVAHDFNNLLTAIIGYGHLLKNEASEDDRISSYIVQILGAAERAAVLTNDLLTFSRKQIVNLQPINLNKIIKNMESLLLRIIGEDIELSAVLTDKDLIIMADSTQIDQILMNLATNAVDAMPKGGSIIISTDRVEINGEYIRTYGYGNFGSYALLSFEDTGIGMDEEIMKRIFEPFFTTKEVGKGTGLGLAMVYGIVKQHEGYINVYSEPGRGTTFKILLPLVQSKVQEIAPENLPTIKGGTETILVAEDDTQARALLKEVLSNAGYHIMETTDGNEAEEVFHRNKDKIDLLILDIVMPKKNGKEVYEEIKKLRPDIKAVFISGYSADIIHKKGILDVGLIFISKPVLPDQLLIVVRKVLDHEI